jgi:hypothetical protein
VPRFGDKVDAGDGAAPALAMADTEADDVPDWPEDAIEQLTALRAVMGDEPGDVEEIAGRFRGARWGDVEKHLETLEVLGVVVRGEDGRWKVQGGVGAASVDAVH